MSNIFEKISSEMKTLIHNKGINSTSNGFKKTKYLSDTLLFIQKKIE